MFCVFCRTQFDETGAKRFCAGCGRELFRGNSNAAEPQDPEQIIPEQPQTQPEPPIDVPEADIPAYGLTQNCVHCGAEFPVSCTYCGSQVSDSDTIIPPEGWMVCSSCNQSFWVICPHCQSTQQKEQELPREQPQSSGSGNMSAGVSGTSDYIDTRGNPAPLGGQPYVPNTPAYQETPQTPPRTSGGTGGRKAPTGAQAKKPRNGNPWKKAAWIAPLVLAPIIMAIIFLPDWEPPWKPSTDWEHNYERPDPPIPSEPYDNTVILDDPVMPEIEVPNNSRPSSANNPYSSVKTGATIKVGKFDWIVLDIQDGKALLLSEKLIDERSYHSYTDVSQNITWDISEMREYLNSGFYNSFSAEDRAFILETHVTTPDNPGDGTPGGNDTDDYFFLLSVQEVVKYLWRPPGADVVYPNFRDNTVVFYGVPGELITADDIIVANALDGFGAGRWWTRTAASGHHGAQLGMLGHSVVYVNRDGVVSLSGASYSAGEPFFTRPAMWINIK